MRVLCNRILSAGEPFDIFKIKLSIKLVNSSKKETFLSKKVLGI